MKRTHILSLVAAGLAAVSLYQYLRGRMDALPGAEVVSSDRTGLHLLSGGYRLDRMYRSMEGPFSPHPNLVLPGHRENSVIWLTGVETEVVDARSAAPASSEFLCHSNLTFDGSAGSPALYNKVFKDQTHLEWRLFTIIPGRFSIRLPEGFGIPIPSTAKLDYFTMSLNQNPQERVVDVRMKTKIHTVAGTDPAAPTKALFRKALYVLEPQSKNASSSQATIVKGLQHVGAGCADFCSVNASAVSTVGRIGEGMTLHWLVPPGKHTYRTEITPQLNLPFDTTIHYATIHVHPYAKGFQMRDLKTGETVLNLSSRDHTDKLGVAHVDEVKSIEGIPIHRDHQYELVCEYENPTQGPVDAMGILYLYLLEKNFTAPAVKSVAER